jgi:fumarylpyruvate hydrolase
MQKLLFPLRVVSLPVIGQAERFPVRRVYCIGQNYADHAKEMGVAKEKIGTGEPFFFDKSADMVVEGPTIRYPPQTSNYHYEGELVVAIGKPGANVTLAEAASMVYGYTVGIDMTRRDLQKKAKDTGRPWDLGKAFDESAPCGAIVPMPGVVLRKGKIELLVNGAIRQSSDLSKMLTAVDEMIVVLSKYVALEAGDLIFTGTPEGVGKVEVGDKIKVSVEGVGSLDITIAPPAKL